MKRFIVFLIVPLFCNPLLAQNKEEAEKLVEQGVNYHDKGDYDGALTKYEKALKLDSNNLLALSEKAYTYLALEKYEDCISCCQKAILTHPSDADLKNVYVTYGNALDAQNKTDLAIEVFDEGLKKFPDAFLIYFNKAITLSSIKEYDEAILNLQSALKNNPWHAGSNNAIARLLDIQNKKIPALLAYTRLLILEPQSDRAKQDHTYLEEIMKGSAEKTGKKSVTINISSDMLADTMADGSPKENSFNTTYLLLTMTAALDYDKKFKDESSVEKFVRKFKLVCSSLKDSKKDNFGFYWDFYVPYFTELYDNNFVETLGYIVYASSDDKDVDKWLKSHQTDIDEFYDWSKGFSWKTD